MLSLFAQLLDARGQRSPWSLSIAMLHRLRVEQPEERHLVACRLTRARDRVEPLDVEAASGRGTTGGTSELLEQRHAVAPGVRPASAR